MSTGLVQTQVIAALSEALGRTSSTGSLEASAIPQLTLELPKREEWGDFSTNVAMTLAPKVRRPPLEVAGVIATELKAGASDLFDRIDVAPPGFLNLTINRIDGLTCFGRSRLLANPLEGANQVKGNGF